MMNLNELNTQFELPEILRFEQEHGLPCVKVTSPAASATVFLHGAHLTQWQPAGEEPVLFLSETSEFAEGKAIRGGVPICFPWFGPRWDGGPGPAHGFARILPWDVGFAGYSGEDVHLTFALNPSDLSRSLGYDHFQVVYELAIGRTLRLRLSVANTGTQPLVFEEALHSYFRVADVRTVRMEGLESALFLDKTDGLREKETPAHALVLTGETDSVFPESVTSVTILEEGSRLGSNPRRVTIDKSNSATTVLWNPWETKAAAIADLAPGSWTEFVCVEAANTGSDRITLAPGEAHRMQVEVYGSHAEPEVAS